MNVCKKATVGVITISLLLGATIVFFFFLFGWSNMFFSDFLLENDLEDKAGNLKFIGVKVSADNMSILGVINEGVAEHTIKDIKIDGVSCGLLVSDVIIEGVNRVDVDCEISKDKTYDVEVFTNRGTFSNVLTVWDQSDEFIQAFRRSFDFGNTCDDSTRIYGMNYTNNSHAEIASSSDYYYSLCVSHNDYTIGNLCSGNYVKLFSLAGVTNSPIYLDNSSAAPEPYTDYYNWQDVCLSSDGGIFDIKYQISAPNPTYICMGSYVLDNYNGGVIGGCSMYEDKIWVSLE